MTNKSRVLRNINATANSRAVRVTGKYASKGINKTAKWVTTDHIGSSHLASMMEFQQSMNYSNASHNLLMRRLGGYDQYPSLLKRSIGWITDHLIYVWDMLMGFIGPIISMILWSLFRIIVIIMVNVIFFYGLYLLLTN